MSNIKISTRTVIESVVYPDSIDGVQIHCNVVTRNDEFLAVEFQTLSYAGSPMMAAFTVSPYGLETEYEGEHKEELLSVLDEFRTILHDDFGAEWLEHEADEEIEVQSDILEGGDE